MPYCSLFYHVIWGTKNRLDLIDPAWEKDLYGYIRGKGTALECFPYAVGGMSDHIHVAISIPPKLSVATVIGQLKGASSHHINKTYVDGSFMWQTEYGVFTFSEKALASVVHYINNQKKHHAENTLNAAMENVAVSGNTR
jgi:putative transposase